MTMMMTGRVLLVCALCVLWCGVSVVMAEAGGGDAEENMVLTWYPETKKGCENQSTKEGKLNKSAFKSCMHESMKEICDAYYSEMPSTSREPAAVEICNNYTGDPEKADDASKSQDKSPHDAVTPEAVTTPETAKVDAAEMGSTPGVPAGDSPANPTEGPHSTSAATDTANSEAEKDGKKVTLKNAPESNATRKEEVEEGEKNHNSAKETPVDADTMKNVTTTAGNDGSTAVSHTTSPLLFLLVVVACAAAAAVVAA
ncbi:Mucin-associated surface protein (MASP) [Trypanosoma cruzi]|uniref:Mucin-associated surface protein (MASP), putative n=2 Tax=Trypanosoma cruzi TaxID=5693 RepID=Q4CSW1_TRYCC|nr:mucin-associated surface protein (MASP), putative [Trypanosoma cruzi]EAN83363.1 mucin-associated surface protein (MASP), putative [Trypanosoma cruzi]PWV17666.1 Mucin-associated surface protein (MASP) [Trypanosoma cruzi]|eukprot:XP_805214.1 mucin-associated surface protein (MASP) [Trypanosoma cruzi strain CL Brener]